MPYQSLLESSALAKATEWIPTRKADVTGRRCVPVELKVRDYVGLRRVKLASVWTAAHVFMRAALRGE